jgi:hypothetical protein
MSNIFRTDEFDNAEANALRETITPSVDLVTYAPAYELRNDGNLQTFSGGTRLSLTT